MPAWLLVFVALPLFFGAFWLSTRRSRHADPDEPDVSSAWEEDDVTTPIDRAALEAAEREIRDDHEAQAAADVVDDDDDNDWGPGTSRSNLPGVF